MTTTPEREPAGDPGMNGAQALIRTLVAAGVDVCFTNPGTSEMHFVAALDQVPGMRGILGLFEGVVTGAADGYARIAGKPAATLLHLGPGLGNGLANLHNGRRAASPVVNIVGDHATYHKQYDAPLESDIVSIATGVSGWIRSSARPDDVAGDGAAAVAAACGPPGQVATLILPADVSWSASSGPVVPCPVVSRSTVSADAIGAVAGVLRSGEPAALFVGGSVVASERGLLAADRVAGGSGASQVQPHDTRESGRRSRRGHGPAEFPPMGQARHSRPAYQYQEPHACDGLPRAGR